MHSAAMSNFVMAFVSCTDLPKSLSRQHLSVHFDDVAATLVADALIQVGSMAYL